MSEISEETVEKVRYAIAYLTTWDCTEEQARAAIAAYQLSPEWLEMARAAAKYRYLLRMGYVSEAMVQEAIAAIDAAAEGK